MVKIVIPAALALALASTTVPAQHNPIARPTAPTAEQVSGRWNGVNLERRSSCANPQNDGDRGTYAQFDITADAVGNLAITQSGITGLSCTYTARYRPERLALGLEGSYSCTDGKQGAFAVGRLVLNAVSMDLRLAIRLSAGESCAVDSILSMARFPGAD